jgi:hypothetical protein
MHRLTSLLILLATIGITGCSLSSSPPKSEVDKGVNWALSAVIDWNYQDRNLFESYKITNQYTEKRTDGAAYIYDFEADCLVHGVNRVSEFGQSPGWAQALPKDDSRTDKFSGGDIHHFTGTFTLIKKGDQWYRQETVR